MEDYVQNVPNAAKLISSLRNSGYDSYAAIEDIIDNSIDAGARNIKIFVETKDKDPCVVIADDGCGMSEEVLDEALKLGSKTDRNDVSDLGKYGMGLCTASISMAKKLEVYTKQNDSVCFYSSQDLDEMIKLDKFVKVLRKASQEEETYFNSLVDENGTIVVLTKLDRISDSNTSQLSSKLSKDIGRIYRKFIDAGIKISVNANEIESFDPLMEDNSDTQIYSDEEYLLPSPIAKGRKEKIRVKIAILPNMNDELMAGNKMNIKTQGFYVLRNNREVAMGQSLDVFQKHNRFNRLRIELSFNASLDNEIGVKFTKDGINPNQALTDFLKQEIGGQISSIDKVLLKNKIADESSTVDHTDSETSIANKSKLLITPEVVIEKRGPRIDKDNGIQKEINETNQPRENFRKIKTSPSGIGARFDTVSMGREGSLYDCRQEGKIIVIEWNIDHPFYNRVILANKGDKNIVSALDYLIFGLASAELKVTNDDNVELISNIKSIMSVNLRSLLS